MKTKLVIPSLILLTSCNLEVSKKNEQSKDINATVKSQQLLIDSLTKKLEEKNAPIANINTPKQEKSKKSKSVGFDLNKISDGVDKSPVVITDVKIGHQSNFSAIGQLTMKNNYTSSAISIELDFGASQKRLKCLIRPNKVTILKVALNESEADNSLTFLVDGVNHGLIVSKAVFSDGYMWAAKRQ